jgi:hypothetical protein
MMNQKIKPMGIPHDSDRAETALSILTLAIGVFGYGRDLVQAVFG